MPTTKLIYGVGRVPKPSEFSLGEIIVNVDDSKVYSKNKNNTVFELGTGAEGGGGGFTTASISESGQFTFADTPVLAFSGSTGIVVTKNANNHIVITATGEAIAENAITASYAHTASYIESTGIDGVLFTSTDGTNQGEVTFSDNSIEVGDSFTATAIDLGTTSKPLFASVSASNDLVFDLNGTSTGESEITFQDNASGARNKIVFQNFAGASFPNPQESIQFYTNNAPIMTVGSRGTSTRRVVVNPDNDSGYNVFFQVKGGAFGDDNLIITSPTMNAVGMGKIPSVAANSTSGSKLHVEGNISASGFLRLAETGSGTLITAHAGAFMYSSSNEFYLGFS